MEIPAARDEGTQIPVTIVHGTKAGPVLALIAGVHGFEYPPILALQSLLLRLDPAAVSGTVIMVHIANLPAFHNRTVYYSPVDHKNLNRVFPGRMDGTHSERIAYMLTTEVIERADYVLDLHSGDACEALQPYVAYKQGASDPSVEEISREMALAFGLDPIVARTDMSADPAASVTCANTAATRGKPAIQVEMGELGEVDQGSVACMEQGIVRVMRHLGMLDGPVEKADCPLFIASMARVKSQAEGLFYPLVQSGQYVRKGKLLGYVTDYFGQRVFEEHAPTSGIVLYMLGTPPVGKEELLVTIGQVD
jgi:predicted deacylase